MNKTYKLYQIDSFTKEKFTGNPAGVLLDSEGLEDLDMVKIAREMNNSETAFFIDKGGDGYDVHLRFFTPKNEVPLCGHATIAAHYINAKNKGFKGHVRLVQRTLAGNLPVDIYENNGEYLIEMTQGDIVIGDELDIDLQRRILKALGLRENDLIREAPIAIVSTGYGKVFVGINDLDLLHSLEPNMNELIEISRDISCNGYHVFTLDLDDKEVLSHGRMFSPISGNNEDPVTGNSNGPLGAYLVHLGLVDNTKDNFTFYAVQGEAMGRPGKIRVSVDIKDKKPILVKIAGSAVEVFSTDISL